MMSIKKNSTGGYDVFYNEKWIICKPTRKGAYRWGVGFIKNMAELYGEIVEWK